ncbi:unnamed protein product, partial [Amoebophrya sp. A25]
STSSCVFLSLEMDHHDIISSMLHPAHDWKLSWTAFLGEDVAKPGHRYRGSLFDPKLLLEVAKSVGSNRFVALRDRLQAAGESSRREEQIALENSPAALLGAGSTPAHADAHHEDVDGTSSTKTSSSRPYCDLRRLAAGNTKTRLLRARYRGLPGEEVYAFRTRTHLLNNAENPGQWHRAKIIEANSDCGLGKDNCLQVRWKDG